MWELVGVACGGGLGSLARYGIGQLALRIFGTHFPSSTLVVNVVGSLLIGMLTAFSFESLFISRFIRLTFVIGFLGGFTTFSTFALETLNLLKEGAYYFGFLNMLLNLVLGLAAAWLGLFTVRSLV